MALKLDYVVRETGGNLVRNLSITVATVITVAVSLSMVGFGFMVNYGVQNATARWEGGIEFVVFMQPEASTESIDSIGRDLDESPAVENYDYVDKEAAYEEFQTLFEDSPEFVESIEPEVLPTSYRVVPLEKDADTIRDLGDQFEEKSGVREVVFAGDTIKAVQSLAKKVTGVIYGLAIVLVIAAALLIINTIRMAVYARRREIEVMKLVGATNWFIRVPFLLEGMVQGLVGASVACFGIWRFEPFFEDLFQGQDLQIIQGWTINSGELAFIYVLVLVLGAGIGAVGAALAVTRFMDV